MFRTLAEHSPNMIFINKGGRVVYANKKCEEVMGYSREEFYDPDFNFMELIAPQDREVVEDNFSRHARGEKVRPAVYNLITRQGERLTAIHSTEIIEYEGGKAILGVVTDITDRVRYEEALRESEEKFRSVVENATDAVISINSRGEVVFWNSAAERIFGYSSEEILGEDITAIMPREYREAHRRGLERVVKGGKPRLIGRIYEAEGLDKEGTVFPVELSLAQWEKGREIHFTGIVRDITERKETEEALKDSEEKYRHLVDNAPVGVYRTTIGGDILYVNDTLASILGYGSPEELIGKDVPARFKNPEEREALIENIQKRGKIDNFETELLTKTGETRNVLLNTTLEGGILSGMIVDITERKENEEELRRNRESLRTIVENEPECVKVVDVDGTLLNMNPAGLAMIEADSLGQVLGRSIIDIVSPEYREVFREFLQNVYRGNRAILDFKIKGLKGTSRWMESHAVPIVEEESGAPRILAITRDITESKEAGEALKERNERLRVIRELDRFISSSLDIGEVYEAFAQGLKRLIPGTVAKSSEN